MRSFRGAMIAMGAAVGTAGVAAVLTVGCGGDDTVVPADSGSDSSDGTVIDVHQDTNPQPDVTNDTFDGGTGDADATPPPDTGTDADADGPVVPPGLVQYGIDQATATCTQFLSCCPGGLGGYDLARCVSDSLGWEDSVSERNLFPRGNVAFNSGAGAACIAAIKTMPCTPPGQTAAEWKPITTACYSVVSGTIPVGQGGCAGSIECQPGAYCNPTVDGGAGSGVCTALSAQGQPCNTNAQGDTMCSYVGSGNPALFCDLINNGDAGPTCQAQLADGTNCVNPNTFYFDDQACTSGLCGDNSQCGGTASYPYSFFCSAYLPDAGGGG